MLNLKAVSYTTVCSVLILSSLNTPVFAAPGDTFTFNNCSATGRVGPLQAACDAAYAATLLAGNVTVTGGIQAWVVPVTATYTIQALGAAGGTNTATQAIVGGQVIGGPFPGGQGASMQGEIALTAGETIFFVVGQMGEDTRVNTEDNAAPGGGGGSFIYRLATDATPLIAAGGGAGASTCLAPGANPDANITVNGNDAELLTNGGMAGNGGTNNVADASSYWAGGGAGWLTDGTSGNNPVDYDFASIDVLDESAEGGRSPQNGALGGTRSNDGTDEGGDGGFGGGGGGGSDNMGTGGGGGYSGGGGAGGSDGACITNTIGGGGGSFNSGANPVDTAAANIGQGSIVVTQGGTGATEAIPTTSFWGLALLSALLGLFGFSKRRKD